MLLVTGEHSPDPSKAEVDAVVSALPNARAVVLDGQEHLADVLDPGFFAATLVPFLQDAK